MQRDKFLHKFFIIDENHTYDNNHIIKYKWLLVLLPLSLLDMSL
jgi:hypothetical protein